MGRNSRCSNLFKSRLVVFLYFIFYWIAHSSCIVLSTSTCWCWRRIFKKLRVNNKSCPHSTITPSQSHNYFITWPSTWIELWASPAITRHLINCIQGKQAGSSNCSLMVCVASQSSDTLRKLIAIDWYQFTRSSKMNDFDLIIILKLNLQLIVMIFFSQVVRLMSMLEHLFSSLSL